MEEKRTNFRFCPVTVRQTEFYNPPPTFRLKMDDTKVMYNYDCYSYEKCQFKDAVEQLRKKGTVLKVNFKR